MERAQSGTVVVTGGQGFIGRAVAELFRRTGYSVVALDCRMSSNEDRHEDEVPCDIADRAQLEAFFGSRNVAGIIHLAAVLPTIAQREPAQATRVNVDGSFFLLEMAREFGVRRIIFGSSVSIYGSYSKETVVSEDDRTAPEDVYGEAKLYVEQLGQAYSRHYGLEWISLRIGRVIGAGARSLTSAWRSEIFEFLGTKQAAEIAIPYPAPERVLLVYIDDLAKMFLALWEASRPAHAIYNAPCESIEVGELKSEVERLNPRISVRLGSVPVAGNPRRLDASRFQQEYGIPNVPVFERLRDAAGRRTF